VCDMCVATDKKTRKLIFCDNLPGQESEDFRKEMAAQNTYVYYGPAGNTEHWQPIDGGYGKLFKSRVHEMRDEYGASGVEDPSLEKLPEIGKKRVLLTRWVAKVHAELHLESKRECWKYFEKTGCLMDFICKNDHKIHPEGFPADYFKSISVPRPPSADHRTTTTIRDLLSRSSVPAPPSAIISSSSSSSLPSSSPLIPSSSLTDANILSDEDEKADEDGEKGGQNDKSDDFFDFDLEASSDDEAVGDEECDSRTVRVIRNGALCVMTV